MSKSLRSYPLGSRKDVVLERLKSRTHGLGFWAAIDAAKNYYKKDDQVQSAVPAREEVR